MSTLILSCNFKDPFPYSLLQVNAFKCLCTSEYTGNECELPYSLCNQRKPCVNGVCIDKAGTYDCQCPVGYGEKFCEMNIDECSSNPCQNNGVCISGLDTYSCICQAGYIGVNCQINIDDCAADPCQNGGTCVDGIRSYSCQCPVGYTGANCEHAIDHCVGQPCLNGGTCVNTPTGYKCTCKPSYYGCRCTKGNVPEPVSLEFIHHTPVSGTINVHKQLGKGDSHRENSVKFGVVASRAYEKLYTTGTDESLFRLAPVPELGAQVLPLELVPAPRHGVQINARTPTNGYVQYGTRSRAQDTQSEQGLCCRFMLYKLPINADFNEYYYSQSTSRVT